MDGDAHEYGQMHYIHGGNRQITYKNKKKSLLHPKSTNLTFHLDHKHRRHIVVCTLTEKKVDNLVTEAIPKVSDQAWIAIRLHELQKSTLQLGQ